VAELSRRSAAEDGFGDGRQRPGRRQTTAQARREEGDHEARGCARACGTGPAQCACVGFVRAFGFNPNPLD
jgi:hypothetical protein